MIDEPNKTCDEQLLKLVAAELTRQQSHIDLIASENYASPAVIALTGTFLTNKYAEGYPAARFYNGCQYVDQIENLANKRLQALFACNHQPGEKFVDCNGKEWVCKQANAHANVQPHSGSQANAAAYAAVLQPKDTILGMDLAAGGHLTHGYKVNFSGQHYRGVAYFVNENDEKLDFASIKKLAIANKPQIIVAGASAYSRTIDWSQFREIATEVGAYLLVDIAHIAGLIVANQHPNPVCHADIITMTTHKTLRGPRGGAILCTASLKRKINRAVFPGIQGGPLMHVIAAKAQAFYEASLPAFIVYQKQVISNAKAFAQKFIAAGFHVVANGTDNHLFTVKICHDKNEKLNGDYAVQILEQINIIANKNAVPYDKLPPTITSGVRFGTAAMTTRGFKEKQFQQLADIIITAWKLDFVVEKKDNKTKTGKTVIVICDQKKLEQLQTAVTKLLAKFSLYQNLS